MEDGGHLELQAWEGSGRSVEVTTGSTRRPESVQGHGEFGKSCVDRTHTKPHWNHPRWARGRSLEKNPEAADNTCGGTQEKTKR
jgi:hypothetical protein